MVKFTEKRAQRRWRGVMAAVGMFGGLTLLTPAHANAWWVGPRGAVIVPPPVVVGPPVIYAAPPPVYYAPPPHHFWVRGHWRGPYWIPGHWA